jgi:GTP cyclohydrolase II
MSELEVRRMTGARIPTSDGDFRLYLYRNNQDDKDNLALVMGDVAGKDDVLVRVHSECFTGDVLGSLRCDCGAQLQQAMEMITAAGEGVLIYLRQEGRGIGLLDKLRSYNLQDAGFDTVDANLILGHQPDERDYAMAASILTDLTVRSIRLLTNNPEKLNGLKGLGITVSDRIPLQTPVTPENAGYLRTKTVRMHHMLNLSRPAELQASSPSGA